jgi:hypothetical protein
MRLPLCHLMASFIKDFDRVVGAACGHAAAIVIVGYIVNDLRFAERHLFTPCAQ